MLKKLATCLAVLALAAPAWAQDKDRASEKTTEADKTFVAKASLSNEMEISLGEVAAKMATRDEVKKFAQMMLDDHGKTKKMMADVLAKKDVKPGMVEPRDLKASADRLTANKGAEFDDAYMKQMVTSHEEAVRLFEDYSKNGSDADIKKFAADTLPAIKHHLEMARKLADNKGGK